LHAKAKAGQRETTDTGVSVAVRVSVRKSSIHGSGVFAEQDIGRGSLIGRFEGRPTRRNGTYVLWVVGHDDRVRGIEGTTELRYLNHARNPNAEFRVDKLFALRPIRRGEEITCHYGDDWEDVEPRASSRAGRERAAPRDYSDTRA
jgi:uncharacterized protein